MSIKKCVKEEDDLSCNIKMDAHVVVSHSSNHNQQLCSYKMKIKDMN